MVMTPEAARRALASIGKASCRHRITSPRIERSMHSTLLNTTGAVITPLDADRPVPKKETRRKENHEIAMVNILCSQSTRYQVAL